MTKRQLSRHERESRQKRLIYAITGVVALVIIAVIGFGYYREEVQRGFAPVARVGETEISARTLANVIGYYRNLYGYQAGEANRVIAENQADAETDEAKKNLVTAASYRLQVIYQLAAQVDQRALDHLIDAELLRQEAARRGIEITDEDRDRALVAHYDLGLEELAKSLAASEEEAEQEPAEKPAPTAEQVAAAKETLRKVSENGAIMSEADVYRYAIEADLLYEKVNEALAAEIPTRGEQVRARHILAETEQAARDALAMIEKGELDFAEAAKQLSIDTSNKEEGGDLGWFPRGMMDKTFEEAAFALEPGQMSDVVVTQFGYHIIKVEEKAADREIDQETLDLLKATAYQRWSSEQKTGENSAVTYLLDYGLLQWASSHAPRGSLAQALG